MKSLIILFFLIYGLAEESKYILINDILYKIPESEIINLKSKYGILDKEITKFSFDSNSCYTSEIEWIKIKYIDAQYNDPYRNYRVKSDPIFIYENKNISIEYFYPQDIKSITAMPKDEAINKYGCKGLNPIFIIALLEGKTIQEKPVGGLKIIREESGNLKSLPKGNDSFTIIGRTKGLKDSSKLYLNKYTGSFRDNIDSAYVINDSFVFQGSVAEPHRYLIHTGYTGFDYPIPENFHEVLLWVDNSTIFLEDKNGDLMFSNLSGSELQEDWMCLREKLKRYLTIGDSLNRLERSSYRRFALQNEILQSMDTANLIYQNFIKSHPESFISIDLLNGSKTQWGREKTTELFSTLSPRIKNTSHGKSIEEYLRTNIVPYNKEAIDLELTSLRGRTIKLSSLKGKYVLLDFWASWCSPCRAENPNLLKLYNKYKDNGFEIYAVSLDTKKEVWEQTVINDKISWITVSDLKGPSNSKAAMLYEITDIPRNFLINREGKIIAEDLHGHDLESKLEEIFK